MTIDCGRFWSGWIRFAGYSGVKPDLARGCYSGGSSIVNSVGFLLAPMADSRCDNQFGCVCRSGTALAKITIFLMEKSNEFH